MKGNNLQNSQSSILKRIYSRRPIVMVIILPFLALGALIYLYYIGMNISVRSEPLLHASAKMQLELSLFHLWFEELVHGDPSLTKERVWKSLKNSERYADVMLDGGVVPEGRVFPIKDPRLRLMIEQSKALIHKFANVAEVRLKNAGESIAGSDIDQRFDGIFLEVLEQTSDVERKIATNISEQYMRYRFITIILGVGMIVITVLAIGSFLRFDRQRRQAEREIRKSYDELEKRVEERTHHLEIEIVERKQAEQAVQQARNDLEKRVEERTRELRDEIVERKQAQAQVIQAAKLATLGEMATSVAHELNQPLNVIRMAAGNVLRKMEKGSVDPTYLNNKLERIAGQTERAATIIDHMQMFGRKADEKQVQIDPRKAMQDALGLMGEQLRLANMDVSLTLPETCPQVLGHKISLEQVILNLLTNARDAIQAAAPDGERKISMTLEDTGTDTVRVMVEDTGGGIPEKIIGRIFEPFYTTKEMGEGTGLGLSVSYGIIRDMGGTIEAENANGGARFTITLPVAGTDMEKGTSDAV